MNKFLPLLATLLVVLLTGCANYKAVPYFQNAAEYIAAQDSANGSHSSETSGVQPSALSLQPSLYDMTIKPKDQLYIFVFSGENEKAVLPFNTIEPSPIQMNSKRILSRGTRQFHSYLVDNEGNIEFPVVGKIHLAGYTIEQANQHVKEKIAPYIKEGVHYMVNTKITNFEVAVLGEVRRPNTYTTSRNKLTVLEALAMAGDMTVYGLRENVKVLRELPDGTYAVHELDMRDANILNSPYYYLQQRDIVYVEPNIAMVQNGKVGTTTRLWVRGAAIAISLGSLLYMVTQ